MPTFIEDPYFSYSATIGDPFSFFFFFFLGTPFVNFESIVQSNTFPSITSLDRRDLTSSRASSLVASRFQPPPPPQLCPSFATEFDSPISSRPISPFPGLREANHTVSPPFFDRHHPRFPALHPTFSIFADRLAATDPVV